MNLLTKEDNNLYNGKYIGKGSAKEARFSFVIDELGAGVERFYFWLLDHAGKIPPYGFGFKKDKDHIIKIKDIYASSETSSYWGVVEQRKGLQQDQISKYMATIGKMIRDLFQILRELRITDERLDYYDDSNKGDESADIALKGIWIDMVEGGAKNPTSVLGLSSQVGFVTLPDFFFKLKPESSDEVNSVVDKLKEMGINAKVREVLKRKLKQFMIWKERTEQELRTSKNFKLKFLRQHFNVIQMYLGWLRPYLKNAQRLQMKPNEENPAIISAFETSEIEIELLLKRHEYETHSDIRPTDARDVEYKKYFPVVLVKFRYIAIPQMAYQQEYQRGAIHAGRSEVVTEGYVCEQKDIDEYRKLQEMDDIELLSSVDDAIGSLGEELTEYLEQAGEVKKGEEKKEEEKGFLGDFSKSFKKYFVAEKKEKQSGVLEPFVGVFHGFGELFGSIIKIPGKKDDSGKKVGFIGKWSEDSEKSQASGDASFHAKLVWNVMKKAFGMLTP
ncbi:hypothetical protein CL618_01940 [archaeon]|nr:hypothetical protein [archaeon]